MTNAYQNNGVKETAFEDIAVSELLLSGVQLVYQHDGSETLTDHFVLGLTSSSSSDPHSVQGVVQVRVTPVNVVQDLRKAVENYFFSAGEEGKKRYR